MPLNPDTLYRCHTCGWKGKMSELGAGLICGKEGCGHNAYMVPPPPRVRVTSSEPGYAHMKMWGEFDEGVTEEEIRDRVYHPHLGGGGLKIDWAARTFFGERHTD